jgi:hypothetical protein
LPVDYTQNPIRDIITIEQPTSQQSTRSRSPSPSSVHKSPTGDQEIDKTSHSHSDEEQPLDDRRSNVSSVPPKKRDITVPQVSQEPSQESQVIFLYIKSFMLFIY